MEFVVLPELVEVADLLVGVASEGTGVRLETGVEILVAEDLLLHVLKKELLVSEVVASRIDDLLGVVDSEVHAGEIIVESLEAIGLLGCLPHSVLVEILQLLDLPPVVLSLQLEHLDLLVEICGLKSQLSVAVALLGVVLVQSEGLEMSVVEETLLSRKFLLQIVALLVPNTLR